MQRPKWIWWLLPALAIFAASIAAASHTSAEVAVTTAPITDGPIVRHVVATGTLQAVTTVDVGTQVSGSVQSLAADYNSLVRTGQVVARLDPSSYEAQLREAQAALSQAEADVNGFKTAVADAQTKLTRAEELWERQLIPRSDLDDARITAATAAADLESGASAVARAQAGVREASVNLEHTVIRSPIDGVVVARNVDVGQTVAASMQAPVLFTIAADFKEMQVNVDVDESDVGGLSPGEPASFEVESYPGETFHGTITEIRLQPVVEQTSAAATAGAAAAAQAAGSAGAVVSYTAIVKVQNPDERLRPGMTATVVADGLRRPDAVRIPNGALSFRPPPDVLDAIGEANTPNVRNAAASDEGVDRGGDPPRQVWRYDGKRFTPVDVRTGLAADGWTELVSGPLRSGESVVIGAQLRRRAFLTFSWGPTPTR
jgi:HlyD family secretion protein